MAILDLTVDAPNGVPGVGPAAHAGHVTESNRGSVNPRRPSISMGRNLKRNGICNRVENI